MRILVTGGAGFIGSFLVDALIERGHTVKVFDNLDSQVHPDGVAPAHLNPAAEFIVGDMRDREALAAALRGVEIIFHKAGAVGVLQSQYLIKHFVDVNLGGTANLLDVLANERDTVRKIIAAASMTSYGEGLYRCPTHGDTRPDLRRAADIAVKGWEPCCSACGSILTPLPTSEEQAYRCNSIYAITKATQEEMIFTFGRTYQVPCVSLRYFNVYGPRQSLSNPYTGVAAIFLSRLKNEKPPLIYEDGLQSRDFISVHDVVRANLAAMENQAADYQAFNVGSGRPITIKTLAEHLAKLCGKSIAPVITSKFRQGDIRHCCADGSKIQRRLGFKPSMEVGEGLRELVAWSSSARADDHFDAMHTELSSRGLTD